MEMLIAENKHLKGLIQERDTKRNSTDSEERCALWPCGGLGLSLAAVNATRLRY